MEGVRTTKYMLREVLRKNQTGKVDWVLKIMEARPKVFVTGPTHELALAASQGDISGIGRKKNVSKGKSETLPD